MNENAPAPLPDLRTLFFARQKSRVVPFVLAEKDNLEVFAKRFSGTERTELLKLVPTVDEGDPDAKQKQLDGQLALIIEGVCDGNGKPLFTAADKELVAGEFADVLDFMATQVMAANGMGVKAAAAIEKNS